jgi:hypothetical protein
MFPLDHTFQLYPKGGDAHGFITDKKVAWAVSRAMM